MAPGDGLVETATTAPRGAGEFVRESMAGLPTMAIDEAATLTSEIASSCLAASGVAAVRVNVERSVGAVRVEVHAPPSVAGPRRYADLADARIESIASVADRWGVDHLATGRIVWFELEMDRRN